MTRGGRRRAEKRMLRERTPAPAGPVYAPVFPKHWTKDILDRLLGGGPLIISKSRQQMKDTPPFRVDFTRTGFEAIVPDVEADLTPTLEDAEALRERVRESLEQGIASAFFTAPAPPFVSDTVDIRLTMTPEKWESTRRRLNLTEAEMALWYRKEES